MKILFTADLHIKLGQKNVPVLWAKNRFHSFIAQLAEMSKQADLLVLGGDVFDSIPKTEELELYFELIASIQIPCLVYAGNHEALKKDTTFLTHLKSVTNKINKLVTIIDDYYSDDVIDILPYNKLKEYNPRDIDFHNRILCTHVRGAIPPHVKPEVPLEIFKRWDVVLAGDLHSYENCQENILYPGSPMTTSFHRNEVDTGAILLDTDTLTHEWLKFDLPQLIRKTIKAGEPTPATDFNHTIYEVEGTLDELQALEANDLIATKISTRETEISLILEQGMSLSDEVREYVQFILQLQNDAVEDVMLEFANHAGKLENE